MYRITWEDGAEHEYDGDRDNITFESDHEGNYIMFSENGRLDAVFFNVRSVEWVED